VKAESPDEELHSFYKDSSVQIVGFIGNSSRSWGRLTAVNAS
jgi:hypothetical protein